MRLIGCLVVLSFVAAIAFAQTPGTGGAGPATRPSTQPSTLPSTRPSGGVPSVPASELLDSLLRPPASTGQPLQPIKEGPMADATTGPGAAAPGAPQLNLTREGSYIVDRTGRLVKSADGQSYEFNFDSDGKALKDPPMVILPNLKLMQMETAVQSSSRDLKFRVTGMVTEYKQRNYILLEKVVVVPDVVQQF